VIDFANNGDLVISDFDSPYQDRYFTARTPGWIFRDLTVHGEFKDNNEYPELGDLTIAVSPDPKSENKYEEELVTFNFGELVRTVANPVADVARLNVKSKNLTLKLLTRKQRFDEFGGLIHVIDARWMGYGNKLLSIYMPTNSDLIGMRLVNMGDHPEYGSDYELFVMYEREDGSLAEDPAGMLSNMLDVYKR
jgi:hypothetical protein